MQQIITSVETSRAVNPEEIKAFSRLVGTEEGVRSLELLSERFSERLVQFLKTVNNAPEALAAAEEEYLVQNILDLDGVVSNIARKGGGSEFCEVICSQPIDVALKVLSGAGVIHDLVMYSAPDPSAFKQSALPGTKEEYEVQAFSRTVDSLDTFVEKIKSLAVGNPDFKTVSDEFGTVKAKAKVMVSELVQKIRMPSLGLGWISGFAKRTFGL
jgi:hypothetical protein